MQNWQQTLLSQYANSPILLAIIQSLNDAIDPSANIDAFYNNIWNIQTATGYGLDVWGRIIGVSRVISLPAGAGTLMSGAFSSFLETGADKTPFGVAPFYSYNPASNNYALSDDSFRALLMIKASANISSCTTLFYNRLLMQLFPGLGNAYVSDTGNMSMRLTFEFELNQFQVAILKQSGAFFAPTGVQMNIMDIIKGQTMGFAEQQNTTVFGQGIFFEGYE